MALVAYSDSEASDAEPEIPTGPTEMTEKPDDSSSTNFHIDRSNPRKIRVAIPRLKPDPPADQTDDGPARKRARVGGGTFSGFNALLPAPKRAAEKPVPAASTRKVFSLKTGAAPGFDREADAEMKNDQALGDMANDVNGDADGRAGPTTTSSGTTLVEPDAPAEMKANTDSPVKLQGNPMMFRPLSVGRPAPKKKKTTKPPPQPTPTSSTAPATQASAASTSAATKVAPEPAPPAPKPKVSLFSLSSETTAEADTSPAAAAAYEPLVYNTESEISSTIAAPASEPAPSTMTEYYPSAAAQASNNQKSLDTIADDLNLSRSERRQLFGRHALPAESRVLTFNTDAEYASNQALAQTELAAAQHNPVRAIAPGKHTLQQLVNAASSQREALEESFATGKRNKKEAGSKYGW